MDDFRKCPITRQLLSPVGFPLEQLSVSVSLGKSPKYTTLEEVLALNSDLHIHTRQCSRSASRGSFQTSNFFKFRRHPHVQAMGGLSVPEQVRPLAPHYQNCSCSPACQSGVDVFQLTSLLSMKDRPQIIVGAAAAAHEHPHGCTFRLVHVTAEIWSSWSLTSLVTGDSKGLTLLSFN